MVDGFSPMTESADGEDTGGEYDDDDDEDDDEDDDDDDSGMPS